MFIFDTRADLRVKSYSHMIILKISLRLAVFLCFSLYIAKNIVCGVFMFQIQRFEIAAIILKLWVNVTHIYNLSTFFVSISDRACFGILIAYGVYSKKQSL